VIGGRVLAGLAAAVGVFGAGAAVAARTGAHRRVWREAVEQAGCPSGRPAAAVARVLDLANREMHREALLLAEPLGLDVLDVGFGGGGVPRMLLARDRDLRVAALDPSPEMVARMERRNEYEIAEGRLDVRLGSAVDLPWDADRFDTVLAINTVYFWEDLDAGLRELVRVLRPGGTVGIALAGLEAQRRLGFEEHGARLVAPDEIADALAGHGLEPVEQLPMRSERRRGAVFVRGLRPD
jgi:SAM-dependent methyltransferase